MTDLNSILTAIVVILAAKPLGKMLAALWSAIKAKRVANKQAKLIALDNVVDNAVAKITKLADAIKKDNDKFTQSLDTAFQKMLDAWLKTPDGLAAIKAKLDSMKSSNSDNQTKVTK